MIHTFAIIGGGSAYAPGLLAALIHQHKKLHLREIRLHDLDQEHLDIVARLASRMALAGEAPFSVLATDNLADAVRGADAVLNSTRPGGLECRRIDESLPLEFGIPGQETVGPGGFFFALRSVPAALHLEQTMATHAPGSVLLNYTNPTNIVTQALVDAGSGRVRVVGLCDQSDEDMETLARSANVPHERLSFRCNGLNHATWYTDLTLDRQPFRVPLDRLVAPADLNAEHQARFEVSVEMATRTPGFWPNSYLPYYEQPQRFVALAKANGLRSDAIMAQLEGYFDHFREEGNREPPKLARHRGTGGFGDLAVRTLLALDAPKSPPLVLNAPNAGRTLEFANETVVETHVSLGDERPAEETPPSLPGGSRSLLARLERYQRAAAEAARGSDEKSVIDALAENPLVQTRDMANSLWGAAKHRYGGRIPWLR